MAHPPHDLLGQLFPEGEGRDDLQRKLVRAFMEGIHQATVEFLLDVLREMSHEDIERMSLELGLEDTGWYHRARESGRIPFNLWVLILTKHWGRVPFDTVYAEKRGYLEAVNLCARGLGLREGCLTMAGLDAILRIFSSATPLAEVDPEPGLRGWIRPFLLTMMLVSRDREGPEG
jgi:hypothetical protein